MLISMQLNTFLLLVSKSALPSLGQDTFALLLDKSALPETVGKSAPMELHSERVKFVRAKR